MSKLKLKITSLGPPRTDVYIDQTDESYSLRESFLYRRELQQRIKRYPNHPNLKGWQTELRQHRKFKIQPSNLKYVLSRRVYNIFEVKSQYNIEADKLWVLPDPNDSNNSRNRYRLRQAFDFSLRKSLLDSIKLQVKELRNNLADRSTDVFFNRPTGNLLEMYKEKLRDLAKSPKKPNASDNFVGIEIEFLSPLNESGMLDLVVKHKLSKYVELKYDGSVEDNDFSHSCDEPGGDGCDCDAPIGHELCVLTKEGAEFRDVIIKVCKMLDEAKAYVNTTCGLHVHIDARNRSHKAMYKRLVQSLPALRWLVPESRRTNDRYCKLVTDTTFPARDREERYKAINGQSYYDHQTIEVRLHSGTVNAEKIIMWVDLLLLIVGHKRDFPWPTDASRVIPSDLYKALRDVPKELRAYFSERYKKFKKQLTDNDSSDLTPQPSEGPPSADEVDALVERASALFNTVGNDNRDLRGVRPVVADNVNEVAGINEIRAALQNAVNTTSLVPRRSHTEINLRSPNPPSAIGSSLYYTLQEDPVRWVVQNVEEEPPAPNVSFEREYNAQPAEHCACDECVRARERARLPD